MATLTESRAAFTARAAEVGLTQAEITTLTGRGIDTLARIAFAAVGPGQNPSDDQVHCSEEDPRPQERWHLPGDLGGASPQPLLT